MRKAIFIFMVFGGAGLWAQETVDDISIVKSILDSNGIKGVAVKDVVAVDSGRVIRLTLRNKDMATDFITKVPESIVKLSKLKYLSLAGNSLTEIPSSIGNLKNLEELDLRRNDLIELPNSIKNLSSLKKLDVRYNQLKEFPSAVLNLKSLWYLHLRGNDIASIPEDIKNMAALKELYMQRNSLTTLPKSIMKMKLTYIELLDNKLCSLPPDLHAWMFKRNERYRELQWCVK